MRLPGLLLVLFVWLSLPRSSVAQSLAKPRPRAVARDIGVARAPADRAATAQAPAACPADEDPPATAHSTGAIGLTLGMASVRGGAFNVGVSASVEGGVYALASWLLLGLRAGVLHSERDDANAGGAIGHTLYDGGLFMRAEARFRRGDIHGVVGMQGEAGLQGGSLTLRGVEETALAPRAAFFVVGEVFVGRFAISLRAGQRFGVWSREGRGDGDLDLGGFELASGFAVRL